MLLVRPSFFKSLRAYLKDIRTTDPHRITELNDGRITFLDYLSEEIIVRDVLKRSNWIICIDNADVLFEKFHPWFKFSIATNPSNYYVFAGRSSHGLTIPPENRLVGKLKDRHLKFECGGDN